MTNNEEWEDKAFEAGRTSGDLVVNILVLSMYYVKM
jgi:hypothetical protein